MRVLVTGAQGFIGRFAVADLLESDPSVHVVGLGRSERTDYRFTHEVTWRGTRHPAPLERSVARAAVDGRYHYVQADLNDTRHLTSLLREARPDVIVHLAASLRDEPPRNLVDTNLGAVVSLLESVVGSGVHPPRIVLGSSGSVYGVVEGRGLPLREDMPCAPIDPYSVSKRAAEDMSRVLGEQHGLDLVWARIFNPVGPGQDERHLCGWLGQQVAAIVAGDAPPEITVGPLHTTRDYLDVRDTASALRALAVSGEPGGTYNVASGVETAGSCILARLEAVAGVSLELRTRALPPRRFDMDRHVADVTRLEALGWAPRYDLDASLGAVLDYYAEEVAGRSVPAVGRPSSARQPITLRPDRTERCSVEVDTGLLARLPDLLQARFGGARLAVLTDERVQGLYGDGVVEALTHAGMEAHAVVVPEGERSKSLAQFEQVIGALHSQSFDRRSVLVNLGGGTITDLGGYVAASYLRGVAYVNVPTTLLAQHDSGIGGKVAVNAPWAKNFIGAFHHPRAVLCDPGVLATLGDRDVRCGVAESIKVALCGAPGLFELLERQVDAVMGRDPAVLEEVVRRSAEHKIALLTPDPYEIDLRRVLNLGHTFGHALEVELAYDDLQHGEAVGYGVALATLIAEESGECPVDDARRILDLIGRYGILAPVDPERLHAAAKRVDDVRLVRGGRLNYVLPTTVRSVEVVPELPDHRIHRAVDALVAHPLLAASTA